METNEYQIGGNHYQSEYQHWDFVHDVKMPYHLGCATKYVSRWRKKNGVQDLQKALHYIAKAEDLRIDYSFCRWNDEAKSHMSRFAIQIGTRDHSSGAFIAICRGDYERARNIIHELISEETANQEITTARGRDGV